MSITDGDYYAAHLIRDIAEAGGLRNRGIPRVVPRSTT